MDKARSGLVYTPYPIDAYTPVAPCVKRLVYLDKASRDAFKDAAMDERGTDARLCAERLDITRLPAIENARTATRVVQPVVHVGVHVIACVPPELIRHRTLLQLAYIG